METAPSSQRPPSSEQSDTPLVDKTVPLMPSLHFFGMFYGKMDTGNGTSPTSSLLGLLEPVPPSATSPEVTDWLPIIAGLVCIFLVLATLLTFVILCQPVARGRSLWGPQEWLPHHPVDASQPQLRLWKHLGSLRCSISSFRRSQLVSQSPLACPMSFSSSQDWDIMESTKM